jgi:2'-5' RNA ligase
MRAFVAVEISERKIIDAITSAQSQLQVNAKPVEPQNLHFTLQFLGEITEEDRDKISAALDSIEFSKFSLELRGVGAFPNARSPRVIWVGTDRDGGDALVDLAKKVEEALVVLGFSSDKPFKPHMTIFRIKNRAGDTSAELEKFKSTSFGVQEISEIKLKKSELTSKGPIYSDLLVVRAR